MVAAGYGTALAWFDLMYDFDAQLQDAKDHFLSLVTPLNKAVSRVLI